MRSCFLLKIAPVSFAAFGPYGDAIFMSAAGEMRVDTTEGYEMRVTAAVFHSCSDALRTNVPRPRQVIGPGHSALVFEDVLPVREDDLDVEDWYAMRRCTTGYDYLYRELDRQC